MSDEKIVKPFLIAAGSDYILSENIVSLSPYDKKTSVRTSGGGGSSHTATINAPLATVLAVFAEHGYDIVTPENLKDKINTPQGPVKVLVP